MTNLGFPVKYTFSLSTGYYRGILSLDYLMGHLRDSQEKRGKSVSNFMLWGFLGKFIITQAVKKFAAFNIKNNFHIVKPLNIF
jgi:hypothetical protein